MTPTALETGSGASGTTGKGGNTAITAMTQETDTQAIGSSGANKLAGWEYVPLPEERHIISPSEQLTLETKTTITSCSLSCEIIFREIGDLMVYFTAECWTGKLPLLKITDWAEVNNVIFFNLFYGKRKIALSGLDYYYFYKTETGYIAGGWTDPKQEWASPNWVGREYIFNQETLIHIEDLLSVPNIEAKAGVMLPNDVAKELNLI